MAPIRTKSEDDDSDGGKFKLGSRVILPPSQRDPVSVGSTTPMT